MTNIVSAVTDPILMKLLEVDSKKKFDFNFLEPDHFTQNFVPKICWTQNFLEPNFILTQSFLDLNFF